MREIAESETREQSTKSTPRAWTAHAPGVRHTVTDTSERPVYREPQRCVEEITMGVSDVHT